jgi:hypothetical protein
LGGGSMEKPKVSKQEIKELSEKTIEYLDMFIKGTINDSVLEKLLLSIGPGKMIWDYLNDRIHVKEIKDELDKILGDKKMIIKEKLDAIKNPLILKKVSVSYGESFVIANFRTNNNTNFSCQIPKDGLPSLMGLLLGAFIGNGNITIPQNRLESVIGELKGLKNRIDELLNNIENEVKKN